MSFVRIKLDLKRLKKIFREFKIKPDDYKNIKKKNE